MVCAYQIPVFVIELVVVLRLAHATHLLEGAFFANMAVTRYVVGQGLAGFMV